MTAFNEKRILLQTPMNLNEQTEDLHEFFELYFSSCVQQIEENSDMPHFRVREDPNVVQQFIGFYTKILDESKLCQENIWTHSMIYTFNQEIIIIFDWGLFLFE